MSVELIVQMVAIVLGSNTLFAFIEWIIERNDKKHDKPEQMMLRALGEEKLGKLLRHWLHADERLADDWRIIESLYTGYRALGGNGEIKKLYEEASQLHITE